MKDALELSPPVLLSGEVIHGYGRGHRLLGVPTANLPAQLLVAQLGRLADGVYCGLAKLEGDDTIHKTVVSIGWNPHFGNDHRTVEAHILNEFDEDFYGAHLRVLICVYMRENRKFDSLCMYSNELISLRNCLTKKFSADLIQEIQNDIKIANTVPVLQTITPEFRDLLQTTEEIHS